MWWAGPFLLNHAFMTDMKYGREPHGGSFDSWSDMYFPLTAPLDTLITTLAIIGFIACIVRRHLNGVALGITGIAARRRRVLRAGQPAGHRSAVEPAPAAVPLSRALPDDDGRRGRAARPGVEPDPRSAGARSCPTSGKAPTFAGVTALVVLIVLGWMYQVLPGGRLEVQADTDKAVYTWGPFTATDTNTKAIGNGWSRYNFMGYEGRGSYYTEYYDVVADDEADR